MCPAELGVGGTEPDESVGIKHGFPLQKDHCLLLPWSHFGYSVLPEQYQVADKSRSLLPSGMQRFSICSVTSLTAHSKKLHSEKGMS